jgi:hypothetical protein
VVTVGLVSAGEVDVVDRNMVEACAVPTEIAKETTNSTAAAAREADLNDFMSNPFLFQELKRRVEQLIYPFQET